MYFINVFILNSPPVSQPLCTFYAHPRYVHVQNKKKNKKSSNPSQTHCDITPVHSKEGPTCAPSHVIGVNPCYTC